jgi:purine-nucleoside phosphorylase
MFKKINEAADFLRSKGMIAPEIGIILGTGLGKLADEIESEIEIDYEDIPHFPISTVEFHHGILIYGKLRGRRVLVMKGRSHTYEGYSTQEITFPIRVMKVLGISCLLVSNACGAMNTAFKKGSLMLIEDHINLLPNPLVGPNIDELGLRFPDMSQAYSKEINQKIIRIAEKNNITLHKGVYVAVTGPNLETRAEYRFLSRIGADVVGMSTTPEVIVANHMKLAVAAISVITDECDPDHLEPVDIDKILYYASQAEAGLVKIFSDLVEEL